MIVIADLHFGKESDSFMKNGMPSQRADLLHRLEWIAQHAADTRQALVLAGDVFNRVNPTSAVISAFFEWLSSVMVPVYIIAGNHDSGVDWSNAAMVRNVNMPNVTVVTAPVTRVPVEDATGSCDVVFWPHMTLGFRDSIGDLTESKYAAEQCREGDTVITHGQVVGEGYANDIFFEAGDAMRIDPAVFPTGTLIVTGHIHKHMLLDLGEDCQVVYPGSVTINNFGEVDEVKGFVEVSLSTREMAFTEWPDDVTPWRYVELDLTEKDETQLDEDAIAEVAEGAVIKITVFAKDYGVVDESAIRSVFGQYGHVTRFETRYEVEREASNAIYENVSHAELLREWVSDEDLAAKLKTRVVRAGTDIIQEVLS